jgi:hypothetical protein
MSGLRPFCLTADDAYELGELLGFLIAWIDHDRQWSDTALEPFLGSPPAYDAGALRADLARFAFLLGQTDPSLVFGEQDGEL